MQTGGHTDGHMDRHDDSWSPFSHTNSPKLGRLMQNTHYAVTVMYLIAFSWTLMWFSSRMIILFCLNCLLPGSEMIWDNSYNLFYILRPVTHLAVLPRVLRFSWHAGKQTESQFWCYETRRRRSRGEISFKCKVSATCLQLCGSKNARNVVPRHDT
jgi:hypothetical protein